VIVGQKGRHRKREEEGNEGRNYMNKKGKK